MNDNIEQHITMVKNGMQIAYLEWLEKQNEINENTRYQAKEFHFGPSGSGRCHLINYFKWYKSRKDEKSYKSLCTMRLGTVMHTEIQGALHYMFKHYKVMCEIPVTCMHTGMGLVKGHLDIAVEIDSDNAVLIDIKTVPAYSWSTLYGTKNKEASAGFNHKLQLGTYAIGLRKDYGYKNIHMYLWHYNKNTSEMQFMEVGSEFEELAEKYWKEASNTLTVLRHTKPDDLAKNVDDLLEIVQPPKYKWECNYCDYTGVCPITRVGEK